MPHAHALFTLVALAVTCTLATSLANAQTMAVAPTDVTLHTLASASLAAGSALASA